MFYGLHRKQILREKNLMASHILPRVQRIYHFRRKFENISNASKTRSLKRFTITVTSWRIHQSLKFLNIKLLKFHTQFSCFSVIFIFMKLFIISYFSQYFL